MASLGSTSGRDPNLVALAGRLLDAIDDFAAEIATAIQARVEFYAPPSDVSTEQLRHSAQTNAEFVLRSFQHDYVPDVSAAQNSGRTRAEQGVPLPTVMAAFRVGFGQIWRSLVEHARADGTVSSDALVDAASEIWAAHDTFSEAAATAHREATLARVLRDEQERSALVGALLEGRLIEELTLWDIADILRLRKSGPFVLVAAEAPHIAQEALPGIENHLRIQGISSAWRLLADAQIGIVRLAGENQLAPLIAHLGSRAQGRIGVSPTYAALTETAAALRFARIAMSSSPLGPVQVTMFDDVPLAAAAVSAPEVMQRVAQAVLGPVLTLPPEQRDLLLTTLAAWRDNSGSATAVGRAMFCHPNTVRHRLRRIEAATGRSLDDPKATAELLIALEATNLPSNP